MQSLGDEEVAALLPWDALIAGIESILLEKGAVAPERTIHTVPDGAGNDAYFLMKPGWVAGNIIGLKAVTFFPDNGSLGLPTVQAGVMLFDGKTGSLIGACEANELTTRRTAAASAVAAKRLVRRDAKRLLVIGTGALAPKTAMAHASVRDYEQIEVWGRDAAKAATVVALLQEEGFAASIAPNLDAAVSTADTISAVTGAIEPLIRGALLQPGTHVDLIGGFTHEMREADDDTIAGATLFVDDRNDGVIAGDLAQPLAAGLIALDELEADLRELVAGAHPGRTSDDQITLFKSAGIALEDLAAARLVFGV